MAARLNLALSGLATAAILLAALVVAAPGPAAKGRRPPPAYHDASSSRVVHMARGPERLARNLVAQAIAGGQVWALPPAAMKHGVVVAEVRRDSYAYERRGARNEPTLMALRAESAHFRGAARVRGAAAG